MTMAIWWAITFKIGNTNTPPRSGDQSDICPRYYHHDDCDSDWVRLLQISADNSAGIIGLTTSLALVENGSDVIIVARNFPGDEDINYTSPKAAAYYRPVPEVDPEQSREEDMGRLGYQKFKRLAAIDAACGVSISNIVEYFERPTIAYTDLLGKYNEQEHFRVLKKEELPNGVVFGTSYKTWTVNPSVYLSWLQSNLAMHGVEFIKHDLTKPEEAFSLVGNPRANMVINCSGNGHQTKYLSGGQSVIVANPCKRIYTRAYANGRFIYVMPRPGAGGTVIGATRDSNDWNPQVDEEARASLLRSAFEICPEIVTNGLPPEYGGFEVLKDIVGRRWARKGGPRIERETKYDKTIIHAYGVAGDGFKMSWGVAAEVVKLL